MHNTAMSDTDKGIDPFAVHELVDRTMILEQLLDDHVAHHVLSAHVDIKGRLEVAQRALHELHISAVKLSLDNDES